MPKNANLDHGIPDQIHDEPVDKCPISSDHDDDYYDITLTSVDFVTYDDTITITIQTTSTIVRSIPTTAGHMSTTVTADANEGTCAKVYFQVRFTYTRPPPREESPEDGSTRKCFDEIRSDCISHLGPPRRS